MSSLTTSGPASAEFDADGLPVIRHLGLQPAWLATRHEAALEPALPIVDAHHHLWEREGGYLLDELLADTGSGHNVVATVFAQCGYAYRSDGAVSLRPVGETTFVASVSRAARARGASTQVCAGIVGHADMTLGAAAVAEVLQAHVEAGAGAFRGIRHITARHDGFNASLLGRPQADLMSSPAFRAGLAELQKMGLSFDAWLYHTQIDQVVDLARAMPDLPIVLNHVGGPLAVGPYAGQRDTAYREWLASMKALAACPNVRVKLGGMAMAICGYDFHQQPTPPSSEQLAAAWEPYLHTPIALFGAERCMFESNFPVDKAMCSYAVLWNTFKRIAAGASADEKAWLFKGTANQFYRLGLD
ncbi:amidohydrolase family protein [Roseateles sp. GG27B]